MNWLKFDVFANRIYIVEVFNSSGISFALSFWFTIISLPVLIVQVIKSHDNYLL